MGIETDSFSDGNAPEAEPSVVDEILVNRLHVNVIELRPVYKLLAVV